MTAAQTHKLTVYLFGDFLKMFTFRKSPEGDILALDPAVSEGEGFILSYEHVGQHSPASVGPSN